MSPSVPFARGRRCTQTCRRTCRQSERTRQQVERLVAESFHTGDMCGDLCGDMCGNMSPVWKHYNWTLSISVILQNGWIGQHFYAATSAIYTLHCVHLLLFIVTCDWLSDWLFCTLAKSSSCFSRHSPTLHLLSYPPHSFSSFPQSPHFQCPPIPLHIPSLSPLRYIHFVNGVSCHVRTGLLGLGWVRVLGLWLGLALGLVLVILKNLVVSVDSFCVAVYWINLQNDSIPAIMEIGEAIKNPAYRIFQTEYSGCLDISAHA